MVTRTTPVHPKYVGFQDGCDDVNCQYDDHFTMMMMMMMMMIWLLNIDCKYDDGIDFDHDGEEDDNCGNDDDNLWLLVIRTKLDIGHAHQLFYEILRFSSKWYTG